MGFTTSGVVKYSMWTLFRLIDQSLVLARVLILLEYTESCNRSHPGRVLKTRGIGPEVVVVIL